MLSTGSSGCDEAGKQEMWYHLVLSKPRGSREEAPRRSAPEAMAVLHPLQVERPDLAYSTETVVATAGEVDMATRAANGRRRRLGFRASDEKGMRVRGGGSGKCERGEGSAGWGGG
jgi:hypothetical protein